MNKENQDVRDLVVDPEEAETVKLIFHKYAIEGYGATRIGQYLQKEGIRKKNGGAITSALVRHAIQNPIYIEILHRGEEVKAFVDVIAEQVRP